MKKIILASAIAAAFVGSVAHAEEAVPETTVAYNVGVASEYRYRGISQSQKDPALSGGVDVTHNPTGFYAGAWASTIKWTKATSNLAGTAYGSGDIEIDLYGGKRGEIVKDVTYDLGTLVYLYPNNKFNKNLAPDYADATTWEIYGQVGYGPAYFKYSYALTNLFGNVNSKGSYYLDAGINQPIADGLVLNLHAGRQVIENSPNGNYNDWKVGVTKDFGFVVGSLAYIGTDAKSSFYSLKNVFNGKEAFVATLTKNF